MQKEVFFFSWKNYVLLSLQTSMRSSSKVLQFVVGMNSHTRTLMTGEHWFASESQERNARVWNGRLLCASTWKGHVLLRSSWGQLRCCLPECSNTTLNFTCPKQTFKLSKLDHDLTYPLKYTCAYTNYWGMFWWFSEPLNTWWKCRSLLSRTDAAGLDHSGIHHHSCFFYLC
jgi:hypothetical protein